MQRRTHASVYRPNTKVLSLSLAAIVAVAVTFAERARLQGFIDEGRGRISRMMLLDQVVWEEVGASNLSSRVSKDSLAAASGLKNGQEMLRIDLGELEGRLMAIPWLESVQIQKKLPSTILVRYTVHYARALGLHKGKLWSVSSAGKWIAPLDRRDRREFGSQLDLPLLASEDSVPMEMAWLDALEAELGGHLLQVHEINYSLEKAKVTAWLELRYQSQSLKISLVAAGKPAQEPLTRLKQVVQYLIDNNILVSSVDLRLGKKVVVNVGKRQ